MSDLPQNASDWQSLAATHSVATSTLHSPSRSFKSGSKIETKQYLLLRTLWPRTRDREQFETDCANQKWISTANLAAAQRQLDRLESWTSYLASFTPNKMETISHQGNQGTFALARYYQHLTTGRSREGHNFLLSKTHFVPEKNRFQPGPDETPSRLPRTPEGTQSGTGRFGGSPGGSGGDDDEDDSYIFNVPLSELATPRSKSEPAALLKCIEDEQIVNTALILFLNALTLHRTIDKSGAWSLVRQPFIVTKVNTRDKLFEARVDGLFQIENKIKAIVEVKPYKRDSFSTGKKIKMQETAQMAAWIAQYQPPPLTSMPAVAPPPASGPAKVLSSNKTSSRAKPAATAKPGPSLKAPASISTPALLQKSRSTSHRRLLISQDHKDIYLIVASFDQDYIQYIQGTGANSGQASISFLTMQEYGPFQVDRVEDMKQLAPILLAFSQQGELRGH